MWFKKRSPPAHPLSRTAGASKSAESGAASLRRLLVPHSLQRLLQEVDYTAGEQLDKNTDSRKVDDPAHQEVQDAVCGALQNIAKFDGVSDIPCRRGHR